VAAGDEPIAYTWKLDGGSWQEGQVVTHTYDLPGDYVVVVTATNCATATASVAHTVTVVPACQQASILSVTTAISDCAVTFGADLAGDSPFAYLWGFGSFGTSTATNPLLDFRATGTYSYTLTVSNCAGAAPPWAGQVTVICSSPRVYLPLVWKQSP
jgi:PKD repeat protein